MKTRYSRHASPYLDRASIPQLERLLAQAEAAAQAPSALLASTTALPRAHWRNLASQRRRALHARLRRS